MAAKLPLPLVMHWGTWQLSNEGMNEPVTDLEKAKQQHQVDNFLVMQNGELFHPKSS